MSTSDFHPSVRTVLASFLFVDIVGFSKVPAAQQHAFKAGLISVLHRYLGNLHRGDYRLRDTGDGALISFLNNPEHALYIALAIAEDLGRAAEGADLSLKDLRTGINLGAVKESIDVEQRPNYVGDGINAAQRIMDFAQPGQITTSRSFMEAVAHLDGAYAALFQHLGARADKHGREHELFSLAPSAAVAERLRYDIASSRPAQVEVDFDLDMLAPPMTLGVPLSAALPLYRRQWVLGLVAVVLMAGLAFLVARWLDSHEPVVAAPANVPPAVSSEPPQAPKATAEREPAPVSAPSAAPLALSPASAAASVAETPTASASTPAPAATTAAPVTTQSVPAAPAPAPAPAPVERAAVKPAQTSPAHEPNPSRTARSKTSENPRQTSPTSADSPAPAAAISPQASLRCSRIMQKAGVGEPLSPEEKKELASSCR